MARPQVVDGRHGLQQLKVATNTLNKQPRIADKEWSSSMGFECGANNLSHCKTYDCYENSERASDFDEFFR
jgi:hypothetical protein